MDTKLLGSILLIVGTSIGAGMLALPIAAAQLGFIGSVMLLIACWFVMTAGAFLLLEVNLWMHQNSNLNTMAKATIGPLGQIVSWLSMLLLMYSLLSAYISGGADLFHNLLGLRGLDIPLWACAVLFTLIFGSVAYLGVRSIDYVNRGLMFIKFGAFFLLIAFLMPLVSSVKLAAGNLYSIPSAAAFTVTITSFGYAAIVPSLRIYFAGDIAKLKKAILIGSLIPLFCYIAWDAVIMGVIPLDGNRGLISIIGAEGSTSLLVNTLTETAANPSISFMAKLFTSVCVLTSFLGVALCIMDFWADGLQLEKKGKNTILIALIAFVPPLVIVLFFPNIFIKALEYAGLYCIVLLMFLPAWMAYSGRYRHHFKSPFTVPGGKPLIIALMITSVLAMIKGLM